VYIVHASLLLIFLGTVVDGIWGWRGTLNLNEGQTSNIVELRDGTARTLPFAIRCDAAPVRKTIRMAPRKSGGPSWPWLRADEMYRRKKLL
jgi:hypothetical protein